MARGVSCAHDAGEALDAGARSAYFVFMTDEAQPPASKTLSPAARRALAEAEARRRAAPPVDPAPEHGGPKGPEPTRYGDWEVRGRASDF